MDDLTPLVTLNLFDKMEPEDIELLDMSPALSHPRSAPATARVGPTEPCLSRDLSTKK